MYGYTYVKTSAQLKPMRRSTAAVLGYTGTGGEPADTIEAAIGALLTPARYRWPVAAMVALGALSHHALDLLLITPSGYSYSVFWPLTQYQPPMPNIYLSSDRWPALVAGILAAIVWLVDRRRTQ